MTPIPALTTPAQPQKARGSAEHLGLGEDGKFHPKGSGDPLPEGTLLSFALVATRTAARPRCSTS